MAPAQSSRLTSKQSNRDDNKENNPSRDLQIAATTKVSKKRKAKEKERERKKRRKKENKGKDKEKKKARAKKAKAKARARDESSSEDTTSSGSGSDSNSDSDSDGDESSVFVPNDYALLQAQNEAMMAELTHLRAQAHQREQLDAAGANETPGASSSGTHTNAPIPASAPVPVGAPARDATPEEPKVVLRPSKKADVTIETLRQDMGVSEDEARWSDIRAGFRDLIIRFNLDFTKPWKEQDKTILGSLYAVARNRFPELQPFANSWATEYLTQETFNHRRGHILNRSKKRQLTVPPAPRPRKPRSPSAGSVVGFHSQPPNRPSQDDPPANLPHKPASSSDRATTANTPRHDVPINSTTCPSSAQRMEVLLPPQTLSRTPSVRAPGSPNRPAAATALPPAVVPGTPAASFPAVPATPTMPAPAVPVAPNTNAAAAPSIVAPATAASATGAVAPATATATPTVVPTTSTRANANASTPANAATARQSGCNKAQAPKPSSRVLRSHGAGCNVPSASTAADTEKVPKPKPKPNPDTSSSSDSLSSSD